VGNCGQVSEISYSGVVADSLPPLRLFIMCCFTGPVSNVANTSIFARWLPHTKPFRQVLAYQMEFATKSDVAMILPIPTPVGAAEDAVSFLNLEKEPEFFSRLEELFPRRTFGAGPEMVMPAMDDGRKVRKLVVVKVGSFEASFVPSLADFARVDARFKLKDKVWQKLPQYKDWGFAVFKLSKDSTTVHPMAFSFPNVQPKMGLFYPTVHIHDGAVHAEEEFNHRLYCQVPAGTKAPRGWEESGKLPSSLGDFKDAGLLEKSGHVYKHGFYGVLPNVDLYA
jgi:hypothetical protein